MTRLRMGLSIPHKSVPSNEALRSSQPYLSNFHKICAALLTQLMLWQPSRRSVHAMAASVRASTSSPLSLSVLMSPFWQKAHRMLQEVKKIVPDPAVPR